MISKQYSKMAMIAVAAASLVFAGCGGKKDDTMSDHAVKPEAVPAAEVVAKPSTNSVYFAFDKSDVNDAGKQILVEYATWLNANAEVNVTIEGNCDERGSREYNLALGQRRADAVREVLISNGVAGDRIDTVSFGEERPVCSRSGEACWAENRRGDVVNR